MSRRTLICVSCRCEIEQVELAGGRMLAICAACEAYGDAGELAAGVALNPAPPQLRVVHGGAPSPVLGGAAQPAAKRGVAAGRR